MVDCSYFFVQKKVQAWCFKNEGLINITNDTFQFCKVNFYFSYVTNEKKNNNEYDA